MIEFTPVTAAVGGAIIGVAAVILFWVNGRIAGISGILYGVFARHSADRNWRLFFVVGLVLGGLLHQTLTGTPLVTRTDFPLPLVILSGLLVGAGTRLGSGCTSGHGVCGVSRLSLRSLVATVVFLAAGMLAATVTNRLLVAAS